jgi:hypothetical protein
VTIQGLVLTGGDGSHGGYAAGAIFNRGTLHLERVFIVGNAAYEIANSGILDNNAGSAGILNHGVLRVHASTFAANRIVALNDWTDVTRIGQDICTYGVSAVIVCTETRFLRAVPAELDGMVADAFSGVADVRDDARVPAVQLLALNLTASSFVNTSFRLPAVADALQSTLPLAGNGFSIWQ